MSEVEPSTVISVELPGSGSLNDALRVLLLDLADRVPGRESNNPAGTSYFVHKWLSDRELHRRPEPEIARLVALVEAEANCRASPGLRSRPQLAVYALWALVSRPGLSGVVHRHNGEVSGAYYVDPGDPDVGGAFTVHGSDGHLERRIQPVAGELLLFPSATLHGVEPYEGERPRIVVSCNLRPLLST
ncbi:MAG: putative 2OG-Fe(II) oxygenase [Gammaproteobacteria bacterium]